MKFCKTSAIIGAAIVGLLFFGTAKADDKATKTQQEHEEHHPDAKAPAHTKSATDMAKGSMKGDDMMGKMDKHQMMGMMNECMLNHKDGKMCDHQVMETCQKNMTQGECSKMMSTAKKQEKSPTKKK